MSFAADRSSSTVSTEEDSQTSLPAPLTAEDQSNLFYSFDELAGIVERCKMVIDGRITDESERGLEPIRDPRHRVKSRIVIKNVLKEQHRQKEAHKIDEAKLAAFYHSAAEETAKAALNRGKEDAIAAKEGSRRRWSASPPLFSQIAAKFRGSGRKGRQRKSESTRLSRSR